MHPDWYLRVPGRPRQIGRNQFVLDLSRRAVLDYLFDTISAILTRYTLRLSVCMPVCLYDSIFLIF